MVDAGNSWVTLAACRDGNLSEPVALETAALDEGGALYRAWQRLDVGRDLEAVAIASVVPSRQAHLQEALMACAGVSPYWIFPGRVPSLPIRYREPERLGADRLANAEGALHRFGDAIVVDLGTALTVDLIEGGGFRGGLIFPGRGAALRALSADAESLPTIAPTTMGVPLVGDSTHAGMASGLYHGYRALVGGVLAKMRQDYGPLPAVATGGGAGVLADLDGLDAVQEDLTLYGIACIHDRALNA